MAESTIKAISQNISSSIDSTKVTNILYAYKNGKLVTFSVNVQITLSSPSHQKVISGLFTNNLPIEITACTIASGGSNNPTNLTAFIMSNGDLVFRGESDITNISYFVSGTFITS